VSARAFLLALPLALAAGCGEPAIIPFEPDRAMLATLDPEAARREAELLLGSERRASLRSARHVGGRAIEFAEGPRRFSVPIDAVRPAIARREGFFEVSTIQGTTFAWASLDDTKEFLNYLEVLKAVRRAD
jgi:hypothetical protein